jgi:ketosteroid isomerase-like protein
MTQTPDIAEHWLQRYGAAWEGADPAAAAELFTEDCQYFETPFSPPACGREGVLHYWSAVPEGQTDVSFRFHLLAVQSSTVIAHWTASFTRRASGSRVALDGVFALEFDDRGLCRTLREWWHREESPLPARAAG